MFGLFQVQAVSRRAAFTRLAGLPAGNRRLLPVFPAFPEAVGKPYRTASGRDTPDRFFPDSGRAGSRARPGGRGEAAVIGGLYRLPAYVEILFGFFPLFGGLLYPASGSGLLRAYPFPSRIG